MIVIFLSSAVIVIKLHNVASKDIRKDRRTESINTHATIALMDSKQPQSVQGQNTQFLNQNQTGGATQTAAQNQNTNQTAAQRRADRFPINALSVAKELEDALYAVLDEVGDDEDLYTAIDDARAIAESLIEDIEAVRETLEREADAIRYDCDERNRVECALDVADLRRLIILYQDEVDKESNKITPLMGYVDEIRDIVESILVELEDAVTYDENEEEKEKTTPAMLCDMLYDVKEILEDLKIMLTKAYFEIMRLSIRMLEGFNDSNKERFADDLRIIARFLA